MSIEEVVGALEVAVAADLKTVPSTSDIAASLAALNPMNTNNPGGYLPSRFYDSGTFLAANTLAPAATLTGLLLMQPYTPPVSAAVRSLSVQVAAAFTSGSAVKMAIYETAPDGWPGALLFQTVSLRTTSIAAASQGPTGVSVVGGKPYWLAISIGNVALPSNGKLWGIPLAAQAPLGFSSTDDATPMTALAWPLTDITVPFPDPAPAVTASNFRSLVFPSVKVGTATTI